MPKQLIPVANRPILEHVLDNIRDLGITDVAIVVGDWAAEIIKVIGDGSRFGLRISYLQQHRPLGLAHCVRLARGFLDTADFVMYLGDNMLPDGITPMAEEFRRGRPAAHVAVHKVADPSAFGVAELDPGGNLVRLEEKPRHPRSDLALIGVYFFTSAIHEAVAAITPSPRGELEITDAIQWLLTHGIEVTAGEYAGYWKDTGRIEDVLACNRRLLTERPAGIAGRVDAASALAGHIVVESGAEVVRSRIDGPVIVGPNARVVDSHIGPNTSIGRDCVVRGTRLIDSIMLDGAALRDAPDVRGSLIGRAPWGS